jgi:hypothetical protein
MRSAVIKGQTSQLTLDFEPGLTERFQCLREVIATGVYQRGLGRVAIDLNQAPGNLSVQLSEDPTRHFSVDSLESYIEKTGDLQPIYYLAEKFLASKSAKVDAAHAQLLAALGQLQPLLKQAGLA